MSSETPEIALDVDAEAPEADAFEQSLAAPVADDDYI